MTDSFPFPDETGEDEPRPGRRRAVLLASGGLGVATLAVLGVLALTGPGQDELEPGPPVAAPVSAATPSAVPSATAGDAAPTAPAEDSALRRGRDPFRGPAAVGGGAGTPDATGEGTAPDPEAQPPSSGPQVQPALDGALPISAPAPGAVGEPGDGLVGDPGGQPGDSGGDETDGRMRSVSLVRVGAQQTAVLAVDGAAQTVRVGDDFGPGGALLLLSLQEGPDDGQWTAVVQRGSGDPFDVVTGQPATLT